MVLETEQSSSHRNHTLSISERHLDKAFLEEPDFLFERKA